MDVAPPPRAEIQAQVIARRLLSWRLSSNVQWTLLLRRAAEIQAQGIARRLLA